MRSVPQPLRPQRVRFGSIPAGGPRKITSTVRRSVRPARRQTRPARIARAAAHIVATAWRNSAQLAALAAVVTLWYTSQNSSATHDQVRIAQQDQIDRRYATAVEQLGSDRAATRVVGISALERLATEFPREQDRVLEVLDQWLKGTDCHTPLITQVAEFMYSDSPHTTATCLTRPTPKLPVWAAPVVDENHHLLVVKSKCPDQSIGTAYIPLKAGSSFKPDPRSTCTLQDW
jgi:hypothetical protein